MLVQFRTKPSIVVSGQAERTFRSSGFIYIRVKEFTPQLFIFLTEIDAHLDAYHVRKLADVLLEGVGENQFIVITLKT